MRGGVQGEVQGVQGCLRGVQGVPGVVQGGVQRFWAEKRLKHEKTRKTLRNCMASLLRSNIQDFVQEVPVGQMAQGTPFRCLPWRRKGGGSSVQPPKYRQYRCTHLHIQNCTYVDIYTHVVSKTCRPPTCKSIASLVSTTHLAASSRMGQG